MKWIEAKIAFDHPDKDLAVDLISEVFYDFGLQGVVVDDPRIEPEEGWAEDVIGRPAHHAVNGYFPNDKRFEKRCKILEKKLLQFKEQLGLIYRISYKAVDEEDWAHAWKAYFWPQKIGRNMVVKPTWRDYRAESDEVVIELDPGMAFGTGTHPTTTMCISLIERYLAKDDLFLDIGTGSGILAIAAVRLGDMLNQAEPDARPLLSGGEKGREDPWQMIFSDAGAFVGDTHQAIIWLMLEPDPYPLPSTGHLDGVCHKILQQAGETFRRKVRPARISIELEENPDPFLASQMGEAPGKGLNRLVQIAGPVFGRLARPKSGQNIGDFMKAFEYLGVPRCHKGLERVGPV